MKRVVSLTILLLLAAAAASAQTNPVSDTVRSILARQERNLVAAAQAMPAEKYGYHPTPQQMSFGQLMLHIANSNLFLCSKISGQAAPAGPKLTATSSKDDLVTHLRGSFSFCHDALANVSDADLGQPVTLFGGRQQPKAAAMIAITDDLSDHYATAANYLRLNGILPPTARRREM